MYSMTRTILLLILIATASAKIGYFWHVTDIHYDANRTTHGDTTRKCWRGGESRGLSSQSHVSKFGDYGCDTSWSLLESAARAMRKLHGDNIEFVLWTGDAGSREAMQDVTHLLRHTFSSQFVFPALGHSDVAGLHSHYEGKQARQLYARVASMWQVWLPTEALSTFEKGGYYTIEQKVRKLRLVALNTNLYTKHHAMNGARHNNDNNAQIQQIPADDDDPAGQWAWLESVLEKCKRNHETVYIIGHALPGLDERHVHNGGAYIGSFQERMSRRYLHIVRKFANVIVGQFFGHVHADSFRVIYSETGEPVSWVFVAPSVAPWRPPSDSSNPGLRLYKFDTDNGQVLDYTQFYLDLNLANQRGKAEWQIEYNMSSYYGLPEITPRSLHSLVESFRDEPGGSELLQRYVRAYTVNLQSVTSYSYSDDYMSSSLSTPPCDRNCKILHYCQITRLGYLDFKRCLRDITSWNNSNNISISFLFIFTFIFINIVLF